MGSVQLLDKTRKIGKLLHNNNSSKVVFNDICEVMNDILDSNVLVISKKGKVLGVGKKDGIESIHEMMIDESVGGFIDATLNERLLSVLSTKENVNLETLGFENVIHIKCSESTEQLKQFNTHHADKGNHQCLPESAAAFKKKG